MPNNIVVVNVSLTSAPTPSALQKTGAVISQGGTVLGVGQYELLTEPSDLTPFLAAPLSMSAIAWSNAYDGQVTATASVAHGIPVGEQFVTNIAGVLPAGFNGTYLAMATSSTQFTYYLTSNPGASTTQGTYTPRSVGELQAMVNTFFGQNPNQPVYVLELGVGSASTGIANLSSFIQNSPQFFYGYLVPRNWDGVSSFLTLIATLESPAAKTYFWVTTNLQNYGKYTSLMKNVLTMIEAPNYGVWPANVITGDTWSGGLATATTTTAHGIAPGQVFNVAGVLPAGYNGAFIAQPGTTGSTLIYAVASDPGMFASGGGLVASLYPSPGIPPTEFSLATSFQTTLNFDPSPTNRVTPIAFAQLNGVTPFPLQGNSALLTTLFNANVSYVGTSSEGGLPNAILRNGHTMDGKSFNYWYDVDWMQINLELNIANAIINGSNNPINPLYYNQQGINRLQLVAVQTGASGISSGIALGSPIPTQLDSATFIKNLNNGAYAGNLVVNAVPFVSYSQANPGDYAIGKYSGFAMVMTPQLGFEHILFNLNVTTFTG